ncbi:MAG: hypothetical protein WD037_04745 [Balneolales bacterium]
MRGLLPDEKTPVENMMIDHKGRIWLQLTYTADSQQWLIITADGTKEKIVNLPKDTMLTHISSHHLGVRLDDVTMALFEPIL